MNILVTGGAGFIGSHLVDALIARGYHVRVYDSLVPQVHGSNDNRSPAHLNPEAEFVHGDMRDWETLRKTLQDVQVVFHQAAEVGVGQSMYEITRYVEANTGGTAVLMELLASARHQIEKLIVASSMSVYGEGAYECPVHGAVFPKLRPTEQLAARDWEARCPVTLDGGSSCGLTLRPLATNEVKPLVPTSIYAISKMDQELICLAVGHAYDIPVVGLCTLAVLKKIKATALAIEAHKTILLEREQIIERADKQNMAFIAVEAFGKADRK